MLPYRAAGEGNTEFVGDFLNQRVSFPNPEDEDERLEGTLLDYDAQSGTASVAVGEQIFEPAIATISSVTVPSARLAQPGESVEGPSVPATGPVSQGDGIPTRADWRVTRMSQVPNEEIQERLQRLRKKFLPGGIPDSWNVQSEQLYHKVPIGDLNNGDIIIMGDSADGVQGFILRMDQENAHVRVLDGLKPAEGTDQQFYVPLSTEVIHMRGSRFENHIINDEPTWVNVPYQHKIKDNRVIPAPSGFMDEPGTGKQKKKTKNPKNLWEQLAAMDKGGRGGGGGGRRSWLLLDDAFATTPPTPPAPVSAATVAEAAEVFAEAVANGSFFTVVALVAVAALLGLPYKRMCSFSFS